MAINDVAREWLYHVGDIPRVGHNFVSGLHELKPKKPKNLKTFSRKPRFSQP